MLAPAIRAAKEGFPVTPKYRDLAGKREACLNANADAARIFLRDGKAPAIGTKITSPSSRPHCRRSRRKATRRSTKGRIAKQLVDSVRAAGGSLTLDDLAKYHTTWRTPLEGRYRGQRIVTMPPPSAGGLAVLETFGIPRRRD